MESYRSADLRQQNLPHVGVFVSDSKEIPDLYRKYAKEPLRDHDRVLVYLNLKANQGAFLYIVSNKVVSVDVFEQ